MGTFLKEIISWVPTDFLYSTQEYTGTNRQILSYSPGLGEGTKYEVESDDTVQAERVRVEGQVEEIGDIHVVGQGNEV